MRAPSGKWYPYRDRLYSPGDFGLDTITLSILCGGPRSRFGRFTVPDRNDTRVFSLVILAECLLVSACGGGGGGSSPQLTTNPLPSITGLSPSSATVGAAGQTLTINGTNFLSSSTVTYNSVAHTATFVNSTQLSISLSASDQATAGDYAVVVTNPSPGGELRTQSTSPSIIPSPVLRVYPHLSLGSERQHKLSPSTGPTSSPVRWSLTTAQPIPPHS